MGEVSGRGRGDIDFNFVTEVLISTFSPSIQINHTLYPPNATYPGLLTPAFVTCSTAMQSAVTFTNSKTYSGSP